MAAVPMIAGTLGALTGSAIKSALGQRSVPEISRSEFRNIYGQYVPMSGAYQEGEDLADRITGVMNPWIDTYADEEQRMRQQQEQYLDDLYMQASGQRSIAREDALKRRRELENAIMGQAASARGRYDVGLNNMARKQAAGMQGQMAAGTRLAAEQERANAEKLWNAAVRDQANQDYISRIFEQKRQASDRQRALLGESARTAAANSEQAFRLDRAGKGAKIASGLAFQNADD